MSTPTLFDAVPVDGIVTSRTKPVFTGAVMEFFVAGNPVPQGSKTYLGSTPDGRPRFKESNQRLPAWRSDIRDAAEAELEDPLIDYRRRLWDAPLLVNLEFRFPRPKSHFLPANNRRPAPVLRDNAPVYMASKPDKDKLTRAVYDALTKVVWVDDARVAAGQEIKIYDHLNPGCRVTISELIP